jgi:hypothetical protein
MTSSLQIHGDLNRINTREQRMTSSLQIHGDLNRINTREQKMSAVQQARSKLSSALLGHTFRYTFSCLMT